MKRLILIFWLGLPIVAAQTAVPADEYLEINADIDGDGITDRLVSEPIRDFGTAGGEWEVFLGKKEGGFVSVGRISAHPLALRVEKLFDSVRLWVYLKASGSSGSFGYYVLKEGRISDLQKIDISPGDGGTDLGGALYETTFPSAQRFTTTKKVPNPIEPAAKAAAHR